MNRLLRHGDHQIPALGRNRTRIIPLEIIRRPVMQVDTFPVRIITGEESPSVDVEFITECEAVRRAVESCPCVYLVRGILVDQPKITNHGGNLTRGIDPSQIIRPEGLGHRIAERRYNRIPGKQHDQREAEDQDATNVHESSDGEDAPAAIVFPVAFRVRVVEVVVGFCVGG